MHEQFAPPKNRLKSRSTVCGWNGKLLLRISIGALVVWSLDVQASQAQYATPLSQIVRHTSAIVEGTVDRIENEYTDQTGPWTRVYLRSLKVHRGKVAQGEQPNRLSFVQRGGKRPGGDLVVSTNVTFVIGETYLFFFSNSGWIIAPYHSLPLRIADIAGRKILLGEHQRAVTGINTSAPEFSGAPLFDDIHATLFPTEPRTDSFVRRPQSTVPVKAMSVQAFLNGLDTSLAPLGVRANGVFQPEPSTRSRRIQLTPHKGYGPPPSQAEQEKADLEPGGPETGPSAPSNEEDN